MIFDQTGSLAATKRHDYLPFGEELIAGQGLRTSGVNGLGYAGDNIQQKFTGYHRDNESGLDFAQARYYANTQGRFTSPDPLMDSAKATDPQSWNRNSYVGNNPLVFSDPSGMSRGPAPMYSSIHDIQGKGSRGNNTVLEDDQVYYEDRLAGRYDQIIAVVEPIDGALEEAQEDTESKGSEPENASGSEFAHARRIPCAPTGEDLVNNPYLDQGFQEANRYARSAGNRGFVEAGGWILMNRKGQLSYFIKPREDRDTSILVYGLGEPQKYIPNYGRDGDIVIADFHTHANELSNPDEVGTANARGVPGIWIYPSGKAEAYGPNRGLLGRSLPRHCR